MLYIALQYLVSTVILFHIHYNDNNYYNSERNNTVNDIILATEKLRKKLENLIELKGLNHWKVLKLSQILDEYILLHYSQKNRDLFKHDL